MQILIQKYGGTSVQSGENRQYVIKHIKAALIKGYKLIVVVSALGRKPNPYATDTLLSAVDYPHTHNSKRELDLLMSCGETIASIVVSNELKSSGITAIALTGAQAGIITNKDFTQAKIKTVDPGRIMKELVTHDVVVVAGFQGCTETGEITTIGRGGSDTTAAALGVALKADRIDVFTDVNGIMTADPKVVKSAKSLDFITYEEICNMAYQGAKVIHPHAVELAMHKDIPISVKSTYSEKKGTLITSSKVQIKDSDGLHVNDRLITGIAHITGISQIRVQMMEENPYLQSDVFKAMAEANISVDFINISPIGIVYTVPTTSKIKAVTILETLGFQPEITENCAKVSVIGEGMSGIPGVASKIVEALINKDVQILQSSDSHTTIWMLIQEDDVNIAINALHDVFELSGPKNPVL